MNEIWLDIKGYEGLYQVSNLGRIKSLKRVVKRKDGYTQSYNEKILKTRTTGRYEMAMLCKERKITPKLVHRIVAETFIPNTENKPIVDHIDTNSWNNCVENLRWVTQKENCLNPLTRINNSNSKKGHRPYLLKHTEESKRKMSEKAKGRVLTKEHRQHLSESHKKYNRKEIFQYEIVKSFI